MRNKDGEPARTDDYSLRRLDKRFCRFSFNYHVRIQNNLAPLCPPPTEPHTQAYKYKKNKINST